MYLYFYLQSILSVKALSCSKKLIRNFLFIFAILCLLKNSNGSCAFFFLILTKWQNKQCPIYVINLNLHVLVYKQRVHINICIDTMEIHGYRTSSPVLLYMAYVPVLPHPFCVSPQPLCIQSCYDVPRMERECVRITSFLCDMLIIYMGKHHFIILSLLYKGETGHIPRCF